jgi:hypothetical protein
MIKLAVNLALPALGIVVAAFTQLALTTLWPGIRAIPFVVVSLDSYVAALLALGLCYLAGRWARHNVPTIVGAVCVAIVPLAWFGLVFKGNLMLGGSTAWFRPLTILILFLASAPLIGVALGWHFSYSKLRRAPRGV